MSVDALLARLEGVKKTGADRWIARCPAHDDKRPSMGVAMSQKNPGNVVVHCFSGCPIDKILGAVGLTVDALFPEKPHYETKAQRRPFFPTDVFLIALHELTVASVIACDTHAKRDVSEADYQRLLVAAGRLNNIAEAAYGR